MNSRQFVSITILLWIAAPLLPRVQADPFIDQIVDVTYGTYAGYGQDLLPGVILGPPHGTGSSAGSTDVLSLGDGGFITLAFTDNRVIDEPGADILIFENAFFTGGDPTNLYCEPAFVEVSQDGLEFRRFPNDYDPDGSPPNNPSNWSGFAGLNPVFSNPENEIDPLDPAVAGGDAFDISVLGFDWIRYIRLIDTGEPPNAALDDDGDEIYDPAAPTLQKSGFDLDAIAAVHSIEEPNPSTPTPSPETTATTTFTATAIKTATPTPNPSTTPSVTPAVDDIDFDLDLSKELFYPGDRFTLDLLIDNQSGHSIQVQCYVILDACGCYFFWPDWSSRINSKTYDFVAGVYQETIFDFIWPQVQSSSNCLAFWGALFSESGMLLDDVRHLKFAYTY